MKVKTIGIVDKEVLDEVYSRIVSKFEDSGITDELLSEIKDELDRIETKRVEQNVRTTATAGFLSRYKGTVTELYDSRKDFASNVKLVERIIAMGHKSITDHNYITLAVEDVSPIIEQIMIGHRLTSFTVKSRREVDFSTAGYYRPEFSGLDGNKLKNSSLDSDYNRHMERLFSDYSYLISEGIKAEDARFILPYSYHSNFVMGMDAHEAERMIAHCLYSKDSRIAEVHEFGQKLREQVLIEFPHLAKEIEKAANRYEKETDMADLIPGGFDIGILDKPELIKYDADIDDMIVASAIAYRKQCSFKAALVAVKDFKPEEKMEIMKAIFNNPSRRELEQVSFTFQIPISLAILTHLTRHRMHSLLVPDFVPIWDLNNYKTPPKVAKEHSEFYHNIFADNKDMYEKFVNAGVRPEDLVYFYLSGHTANVVTTMNGSAFDWVSNLRMCEKTQWETREIFNELAAQVKKVASLYGTGIGPSCEKFGKCPEGKECCGKVKMIKKGSIV